MRSRALAAAVCVLLICVGRAWAQAPDPVLLEELTWTELRNLIGAKATTIIVPVGGPEQHGPHITLGKHNARVKILSEKIARALGGTLVAPVTIATLSLRRMRCSIAAKRSRGGAALLDLARGRT